MKTERRELGHFIKCEDKASEDGDTSGRMRGSDYRLINLQDENEWEGGGRIPASHVNQT